MSLAASRGFKIKAASYTIRPFPVSLLYSLPKKKLCTVQKIFGTIVTVAITGAVMILAASQSPVSSHGVMTSSAPAAGAQFLSDHNISSIYLVIYLSISPHSVLIARESVQWSVSVCRWSHDGDTPSPASSCLMADGCVTKHGEIPQTVAAASCWCDALIVKLSPQQFQSSTETSS